MAALWAMGSVTFCSPAGNRYATACATAARFNNAELAFRPAEGLYTVAETLLHVAHEEEIEVRYGITRALLELPPAYDALNFSSVPSVLEVFADVHGRTIVYLMGVTDEALLSEIETPWGARMQQAEMLMHVLEHELHHRGELSLMLGLLGRPGLDA